MLEALASIRPSVRLSGQHQFAIETSSVDELAVMPVATRGQAVGLILSRSCVSVHAYSS